jgi:hypothetical protein
VAKKKLSVWVPEAVATELRQRADRHSLTLSEVAGRYLEIAVQDGAAPSGELLVPALERAVQRELSKQTERLARLLARTALESNATRNLLNAALAEGFPAAGRGWGQDAVREVSMSAWRAAVARLKKPAAELGEVAGALEREASAEPPVRAGVLEEAGVQVEARRLRVLLEEENRGLRARHDMAVMELEVVTLELERATKAKRGLFGR